MERSKNMRQLATAAGMCAVFIAACAGSPADMSQDKAESLAKPIAQGMSASPVVFVSASSGPLGEFEATVGASAPDPTNQQVWAMVFRGTFQSSCGASSSNPHACPPPNTTTQVILDSSTGAFILAETPAG
jgi:hypothetical protein